MSLNKIHKELNSIEEYAIGESDYLGLSISPGSETIRLIYNIWSSEDEPVTSTNDLLEYVLARLEDYGNRILRIVEIVRKKKGIVVDNTARLG